MTNPLAIATLVAAVPSLTKVLFLAASPDDRLLRSVTDEHTQISRQLRDNERFQLEVSFESKTTELLRLLMSVKPDVLHFSGHGTEQGELVFLDEDDQPRSADPAAIARMFQHLRSPIRCVVLNACYSERQAEQIAAHVEAVIGMPDRIEHGQAIAFAQGFYTALGFDHSIEEAFEIGKNQAALADVPFEPVLITRHHADSGSLQHSRFTHMLDRTLYWKTLRSSCDAEPDHRSFIVHGSSRQNVEFFLVRVNRYFQSREGRRHKIVQVSSDLDYRRAVTADDWGLHLRAALSRSDWALDEALDDIIRSEALMIVLCHGSRPLRTRSAGDNIGLNDEERRGLCEFLGQLLPAQLRRIRAANPVRVIVPIEYPEYRGAEPDDPLLLDAERAMQAAPGIRYERIVELTQPSWADVWESIKAQYRDVERREPPEAVASACRRTYERMRERSFAELATALAAEIDFDPDAPRART